MSEQPTPEAGYLTTKTAAAYIGVSPAGFHRAAIRHGVPHVRYGWKRLYKREDIDRWLELNRQLRDARVRR